MNLISHELFQAPDDGGGFDDGGAERRADLLGKYGWIPTVVVVFILIGGAFLLEGNG